MDIATRPSHTAARARELLVLASILASALWAIAIVDAATSRAGRGGVSGLPLGTDFVNFYALAHIGRTGLYDRLASVEAFHAEQVRLLPETAADLYPPVYPPQLALLLAPLARLQYSTAYLTWIALTIAVYAMSVWRLAASSRWLPQWPSQVAAVAAASPALWFTVLHGQVSAIPLAGFVGAWAGLSAGRPWLAGAALGALVVKPSLFVPAVAVLLVARAWRVAVGAVLGAFVVTIATLPWIGTAALSQYATFTLEVLRAPDRVASNLPMMHSLRTLWTGWLSGPLATTAYAVSAGAVAAWAALAWRRLTRPLDRVAVVAGVVALTSPHLFAYDLLILTPLVVASADCLLAGADGRWLRRLTYLGFLAPLWGVPLATLGLQVSTVALIAWLVVFADAAQTRPADRPTAA